MKKILLFVMLCCMTGPLFAQCPDDPVEDARVINAIGLLLPGGVSLNLCKQYTLHNEVIFQMNDDFGISQNQSLWLNFGDGTSQVVAEGMSVLHNYPVSNGTSTEYLISLTLKEPGLPPVNSLNHKLVIKASYTSGGIGYVAPDDIWDISTTGSMPPPVFGAFPPGSPYNGAAIGGARAYIKYAPAHNGKLLKPLIFVDGIDFNAKAYTYDGEVIRHGSTGWDVLMMGNDASEPNPYNTLESEFSGYPAAFTTFMASPNDYDIVFLDFAVGADWIEKNGMLLVELIQRINEEKAINLAQGETVCDNAIIGASMGGQVSKWALSYMEENGLQHQCHTYVSFDSPHQGAHIPIGIQSMAYFTGYIKGDNDQWASLNTPAARQMLIETLEGGIAAGRLGASMNELSLCGASSSSLSPGLGFSLSNAIRTAFKNEIGTLGYPRMTRNVAISCGSHTGMEMGGNANFKARRHEFFNAQQFGSFGGDVASFEMTGFDGGNLSISDLLAFISLPGNPPIPCNFEVPAISNTLFLGAVPTDFWEFPIIQGVTIELPIGYTAYRVRALADYPSLDNAPGCRRGDLLDIQHALLTEDDNFTIDANDGYNSFMPTISLLDIQWPMDDEHLTMSFDPNDAAWVEANTPFDAVFAPETNLRHVELTPAMVTWTLEQLALGLAASQSLNLTAGQTYNYGNRKNRVPDVTINAGARLAVNLTGTINYMTPQDPVANKAHFDVYTGGGCDQGKVITVKSGGVLQIGDPGSAKTGLFHALEQSVIHVQSGGTLRISNASGLKIYQGATLILDPEAIVQMDAVTSNIRIEGDLVVNGDIRFLGLGFFDFAEGNELVFGPGYNTFNLKGAGKDKRFVRLSAPVAINNGHRLNWGQGLVEVAQAASPFYLQSGAGLNFTAMTLQGAGGATVIDAAFAGPITLESCKIEFLNDAIIGDVVADCLISACEFSDYNNTQVLWSNSQNIKILNSTFDGGGAENALWFINVSQAYLKGSSFQGHGAALSDPYDDNALYDGGSAAHLWNIPVCLVEDCHFNGNAVAVKAEDASMPANIYIYKGSSFINNDAAVYANGDQTRGTVLSDCAVFDENRNGIRGRDIALMIDSWNSKIHAFDLDQPNRFIRHNAGTDNHVRICYQLKGVGGSNLMRNNYWGIHTGGAPVADPIPQDYIFLRNAACAPFTPPVNPVFAPFSSKDPICGPRERPAGQAPAAGTDCSMIVGGTPARPVMLHDQFHLGLFLLRADSFEQAINVLRPVADQWQPVMNTFSDNCQQYIKVAKAIVDGSDAEGLPRPAPQRSEAKKALNPLVVAPNPADHYALLHLPEEEALIKVWNAQGQLEIQAAGAGTYRLETSQLAAGVYFIEVNTPDGARKNAKLLIQR